MSDNPAQHADPVRMTRGFDGKRAGAFPPVYIGDWCRWKAVPTEQLIGELRHWADYLESLLNDGVDPATALSCDIPGCDHRRSTRGYGPAQTDGDALAQSYGFCCGEFPRCTHIDGSACGPT